MFSSVSLLIFSSAFSPLSLASFPPPHHSLPPTTLDSRSAEGGEGGLFDVAGWGVKSPASTLAHLLVMKV